jgi:hypothetical protein
VFGWIVIALGALGVILRARQAWRAARVIRMLRVS